MSNASPQTELYRNEKSSAAMARAAMILALVCGGVMLMLNIPALPRVTGPGAPFHVYFGSASLALAGIGYALLQIRLRPSWQILWKRLMIAATFVAWAVDALLPPGPVAIFIGDAVIAAYVLDLFWITQEQTAAN